MTAIGVPNSAHGLPDPPGADRSGNCTDPLSPVAILAGTFLFVVDLLPDMASPDSTDRSVREVVAETLADHPVAVGFLFGSYARGDAHDRSDLDVAVAFEDDPSTLETRLALGADLALALGTDDVDVVDLRTAPASLVRAVFRDGDRLVGTDTQAHRLRATVLDGEDDDRSPAKRFDDALAAIDDHLA